MIFCCNHGLVPAQLPPERLPQKLMAEPDTRQTQGTNPTEEWEEGLTELEVLRALQEDLQNKLTWTPGHS